MTASIVVVNECKVFATRRGSDWWALYRARHGDRIHDVTVTLGGNICHVPCDDRAHAEWLVDHMITQGIPKSALSVRALCDEITRRAGEVRDEP